jgi:serine beta-lactamase-like protein LACTB, mitochondrial
VASGEKIIWMNALGFSDIENQVKASPQSVYRIASISKCITAVAIMQLVEQGRINLDDDARKYVPYFPRKKWRFSVRQILNHTSGLRSYRPGEFDSKEYYVSSQSALNLILKDSLEFEPGTKYLYTTLGYNFLAAVIESVSGIPFAEFIKKNIFEPAGMNSTFPEFQNEIVMNRARGYNKNNFREFENAPLADLSVKFPGGGLISSTEDLLKFSIAILNGKLIKAATLDSMRIPVKLKNGDTRTYGLGFSLDTDANGKKYIYHLGGGTGFTSLLVIYPDEKISAVHLINLRDRNLDRPAYTLANIAQNRTYEKPKQPAADALLNITLSFGIDSAISIYQVLKKDSSDKYILTREELNLFGRDLILINNLTESIKFYKILLAEYPTFSDAHISLADAYYKDGNKGLALRFYKSALKLEPSNKYLQDMIKRLDP